MHRTGLVPAPAVGLVGERVVKAGWAGRVRNVIILGLLGGVAVAVGHDRDGPPDEDHSLRIWPTVL